MKQQIVTKNMINISLILSAYYLHSANGNVLLKSTGKYE